MNAISNTLQFPTERSTTVCTNCGGTGWVRCKSDNNKTTVCRCWICSAVGHGVRYTLEALQDPVNDGRYTVMLIEK